ncbi:hypothetical protein TRFO_18275 [Tritrichomonas foetus]|uniref:Uncharacterized protein n=1 Tax=Tritrichomonas foetus TaxID=1144522 RepID=A0A1J4KL28_9EUKA|nr:hypothetical protein TRFO_18275 [Tritrichomonas foetus]|eukprot:OHT11999.1 hypothetical protein TRFO_18275 [Tritrichomonas foetus]
MFFSAEIFTKVKIGFIILDGYMNKEPNKSPPKGTVDKSWPAFVNIDDEIEIPPLEKRRKNIYFSLNPTNKSFFLPNDSASKNTQLGDKETRKQASNDDKNNQKPPKNKNYKYEKYRIQKSKQKIIGFIMEDSRPYKWMIKTFNRIITQKEFNSIYESLKSKLSPHAAPQRDENRSQVIRFSWMDDNWDNIDTRNVIIKQITEVMRHKKMRNIY